MDPQTQQPQSTEPNPFRKAPEKTPTPKKVVTHAEVPKTENSLEDGFWGTPEAASAAPVSANPLEAEAANTPSGGDLYSALPTKPLSSPSVAVPMKDIYENASSDLSLTDVLFSFNGRISRATFWTYVVAVTIIAFIIGLTPLVNSKFFMSLFAIASYWMGFAVTAKRYHDLNKSGFWSLLSLIPVVNIWVLIETGFFRGENTSNQYGPPC